MPKRTPVVFLAAALALSVGNAAAVPYTFTNIAEIGIGPHDFLAGASLNNRGTVAFVAFLNTGEEGIFTGNGGPITTIADTSGPFGGFESGGSPSLNDSGTVAFVTGQGIFTGNGGPITTLYDSSGPFDGFLFGGGPSLNDRGTVAFSAFLNTNEQGIFISSGGPITTIADTSGQFSGVFAPSLNESGTVAFLGHLDTGEQGIFTGSGGPTTTIADSSGPLSFAQAPTLNDSGIVAFNGVLDTGGERIFAGSGGPTTTIADSSGPFSVGFPSLNDSGTVAFNLFNFETGESGIFTGPDPLEDEVISTGDTLFGSTVASLSLFTDSLNDNGQIAFNYFLDDGRIGFARADPLVTPVPEPGTLPLLVAGVLGAMLWRKGKST